MKFSIPIYLSSVLAISSSTLSSAASSSSVLRGSSRNSPSSNNNANDIQEHRVLEEGIDGTFLVKVTEYPDDETRRNLQGNSDNKNPNKQEIAYSIQTQDGLIYDIEDGSTNWQVGLVSGSDSIAIPAGTTMLPNGKIKMNGLKKPNKVDIQCLLIIQVRGRVKAGVSLVDATFVKSETSKKSLTCPQATATRSK